MRLSKSHQLAKEHLHQAKIKTSERFNKDKSLRIFAVGDMVYLSNETLRRGHSKKLTSTFTGPYEITKIHAPLNVTIKIKNKLSKVHTNRIKHAVIGKPLQ